MKKKADLDVSDCEAQTCKINEQLFAWFQATERHIIFDSDIDEQSHTSFYQSVLHKPNLCFIFEDSKGEKFGFFTTQPLCKTGNWKFNVGRHFIFKLPTKKSKDAHRYYPDPREQCGICLFEEGVLICACGGLNGVGVLGISRTSSKGSIHICLSAVYNMTDDLTSCPSRLFVMERIVVIQYY
ncbi:hypothetical protein EIN_403590 [Entamoeba invadens IP1]|uniref:TLDc domain-containing protein n=1 Tax=Entamoeba invadens IP1 TaxID=370355 RepID=A0A0A1U6S4_ENTIV|nr:hypothetical protein EIN_403590 [Entamoeba invadens IP1]ELP90025.1 hypothetical protein EIN_403590 [Entamoeba invadens IP1]|eukprot:XP_004256796.1 hypothetical protein EIN_403590 [Entamoeba invadens IP1]